MKEQTYLNDDSITNYTKVVFLVFSFACLFMLCRYTCDKQISYVLFIHVRGYTCKLVFVFFSFISFGIFVFFFLVYHAYTQP